MRLFYLTLLATMGLFLLMTLYTAHSMHKDYQLVEDCCAVSVDKLRIADNAVQHAAERIKRLEDDIAHLHGQVAVLTDQIAKVKPPVKKITTTTPQGVRKIWSNSPNLSIRK